MPTWGYSVKEFDPDRAVRCSGRELKISPKAAVEICRKLRGMRLDSAKELLEAVTKKKRAILTGGTIRKFPTEASTKAGMRAAIRLRPPRHSCFS